MFVVANLFSLIRKRELRVDEEADNFIDPVTLPPLLRLPNEVLRMAISYLTPQEFLNLALTCRRAHTVLFQFCSINISPTFPLLTFVHRPRGAFQGSWLTTDRPLSGIPISAFEQVSIRARGVSVVIELEEHVEETMEAASDFFKHQQFGRVTIEIVGNLPSSVNGEVFEQFVKNTKSSFVCTQGCFPFRLQEVPSVARSSFVCETFLDKSDDAWKGVCFLGDLVLIRELPNLQILENTLKKFLAGNLKKFFHAYLVANEATKELNRLLYIYANRVTSITVSRLGYRTVVFRSGQRKMEMIVWAREDLLPESGVPFQLVLTERQ